MKAVVLNRQKDEAVRVEGLSMDQNAECLTVLGIYSPTL